MLGRSDDLAVNRIPHWLPRRSIQFPDVIEELRRETVRACSTVSVIGRASPTNAFKFGFQGRDVYLQALVRRLLRACA